MSWCPAPHPGGPGGPGPGQPGQDLHRGGPPPVHHPERRPHRGVPGRRGGGTGHTPAAAGPEGLLPHAGHQADGPQPLRPEQGRTEHSHRTHALSVFD